MMVYLSFRCYISHTFLSLLERVYKSQYLAIFPVLLIVIVDFVTVVFSGRCVVIVNFVLVFFFREMRCLRHKIHMGLFCTFGLSALNWILTLSWKNLVCPLRKFWTS